ncbi:MAG: 3-ketoacyl-ACP reductase [Candidatus Saccharibacteria bacterium]|nr:3-ketoacyl-ACP reductase [Pseudorhodobacter sp.]
MKQALITGGQQGIGFGIARALHGAGFQIAMAAEVSPEADTVVAALQALPGARYFQHDLAQGDVAALLQAVGPVDCLVSNAGVPARVRGDMLDLTPDNFDFAMGINLRGTFFLAQAVARQMLATEARAYRSLIFVTSVSAQMVSVERAEYCLSKSAAAMMAQLFAVRLAAANIGVYDLRPGIIATPMTAGVAAKYDAAIPDLVPAGRWGQAGDVGAVAVPLALGQMQFATGAVLPVDGGLSIQRL